MPAISYHPCIHASMLLMLNSPIPRPHPFLPALSPTRNPSLNKLLNILTPPPQTTHNPSLPIPFLPLLSNPLNNNPLLPFPPFPFLINHNPRTHRQSTPSESLNLISFIILKMS